VVAMNLIHELRSANLFSIGINNYWIITNMQR